MSYFSDHLAWQQRVKQEFNQQAATNVPQSIIQQNGQYYNYPELVGYLKTATENQHFIPKDQIVQRKFGQTFNYKMFPAGGMIPNIEYDMMNDSNKSPQPHDSLTRKEIIRMARDRSVDDRIKEAIFGKSPPDAEQDGNYSYASRRKMIYQREKDKKSQRSSHKSEIGSYLSARKNFLGKSSDSKSYLGRGNIQRFNEDLGTGLKGAAARSIFSDKKEPSKAGVMMSPSRHSKMNPPASVFSRPSQKFKSKMALNENSQDVTVSPRLERERYTSPLKQEEGELDRDELNMVDDAEEYGDEVDEDRFTSVSNIQPAPSGLSRLSSKTYISALQRQLDEERTARVKLENEMMELKKFSEDINSHLEEIKQQQSHK